MQRSYIIVISDSIQIVISQIDVCFSNFHIKMETHSIYTLVWLRHFQLVREWSKQVDLPVLWQGTSILTITWGHAELSRTVHDSHLQSDLCLSVLLLPPTKQWHMINMKWYLFYTCNHSYKIYIEEIIDIIYTIRFVSISPHQQVASFTSFKVTNNYKRLWNDLHFS